MVCDVTLVCISYVSTYLKVFVVIVWYLATAFEDDIRFKFFGSCDFLDPSGNSTLKTNLYLGTDTLLHK